MVLVWGRCTFAFLRGLPAARGSSVRGLRARPPERAPEPRGPVTRPSVCARSLARPWWAGALGRVLAEPPGRVRLANLHPCFCTSLRW